MATKQKTNYRRIKKGDRVRTLGTCSSGHKKVGPGNYGTVIGMEGTRESAEYTLFKVKIDGRAAPAFHEAWLFWEEELHLVRGQ